MMGDMSYAQPSAYRAFVALVWFTVRRQGRVRGLGGVALGLLGLLSFTVGVNTRSPGWELLDQFSRSMRTRVSATPDTFTQLQILTLSGPGHLAAELGLVGGYRAALHDPVFRADWALLRFTRTVLIWLYLGFLLPLFTLAFGTAAVGGEREGRTLIWLLTRPLPRWALYLAELLGALPWGILAGVGGMAVLCLAGGRIGRDVFALAWPAAVAGSLAFTALFVLVGAVVRRPAVVGLVYVFFFETLVASLPGSLKQLSLNYYVRSLLYNATSERLTAVAPTGLDVYAPADSSTAWATLAVATVGFTLLGMWLFGRQEPTEET